MTKDEALKLALEALIAAKTNHGVMLMSDPPQEAWKFNQVDLKIFRAEEALRQALSQPDPFDRLIRIMGTFDLSTGHADNWTDLLDSLESELRDVLGYYREMFKAEPKCSSHPDAPHGFNRDASHSIGRYVCDCEGWTPDDMAYRPGGLSMDDEMEPVGYADKHDLEREGHDFWVSRERGKESVALYTAPPKREWQGLTDEEILEAAGIDGADTWVFETAYAIEAKLKDKNT